MQDRAIDRTDRYEKQRKNKMPEGVKLVVRSFDDVILEPGTAFGE